MLMSSIAEGRWFWVFERCAFRERLFLRWCVWGCFSPPPARPAAHSLSTTTGTSRAVPQRLRASRAVPQCLRALGSRCALDDLPHPGLEASWTAYELQG